MRVLVALCAFVALTMLSISPASAQYGCYQGPVYQPAPVFQSHCGPFHRHCQPACGQPMCCPPRYVQPRFVQPHFAQPGCCPPQSFQQHSCPPQFFPHATQGFQFTSPYEQCVRQCLDNCGNCGAQVLNQCLTYCEDVHINGTNPLFIPICFTTGECFSNVSWAHGGCSNPPQYCPPRYLSLIHI